MIPDGSCTCMIVAPHHCAWCVVSRACIHGMHYAIEWRLARCICMMCTCTWSSRPMCMAWAFIIYIRMPPLASGVASNLCQQHLKFDIGLTLWALTLNSQVRSSRWSHICWCLSLDSHVELSHWTRNLQTSYKLCMIHITANSCFKVSKFTLASNS